MRIDFRTRRRRRRVSATIGSGAAPRPTVRSSSAGSSRALPGSGGARLAPEAEYIGRRRNVVGRSQNSTIFPRRRRPAAFLRRLVLSTLILAALALLTISYRNSRPVNGAQMVVLEAVQPIERGLTRAWQPVQSSFDWFTRLVSAADENPQLKDRVDELEARLAREQKTEEENARLRKIVGLDERGRYPYGYRRVVGSVIARSPSAVDRSFVIDLGSADGVAVNDPVMVTRGLVGRIEAVSANAARVGLIINRQQAVSASVVGSTATGVLLATTSEGSPVLRLGYVSQRSSVHNGDLVVTSGWSSGELNSIYPKGLPVGIVTSVGSSPADLYRTVQVKPFADFDRIDEVIVLTPRGGQQTFIEPVTPAPGDVSDVRSTRRADVAVHRPRGNPRPQARSSAAAATKGASSG